MEATSYLAGEDWSDHPQCVSSVISAFCRKWNDNLSNEDLQILKPYAAKVIGTNTNEADEETRAWLCADWLVRTFTPAWLRRAGLVEHAEKLERLEEFTATEYAERALPIIKEARKASAAAWAAARAAARAAAGAAARAAARAALAPTVKELQQSALGLLERMIAVGKST